MLTQNSYHPIAVYCYNRKLSIKSNRLKCIKANIRYKTYVELLEAVMKRLSYHAYNATHSKTQITYTSIMLLDCFHHLCKYFSGDIPPPLSTKISKRKI